MLRARRGHARAREDIRRILKRFALPPAATADGEDATATTHAPRRGAVTPDTSRERPLRRADPDPDLETAGRSPRLQAASSARRRSLRSPLHTIIAGSPQSVRELRTPEVCCRPRSRCSRSASLCYSTQRRCSATPTATCARYIGAAAIASSSGPRWRSAPICSAAPRPRAGGSTTRRSRSPTCCSSAALTRPSSRARRSSAWTTDSRRST